MEKRLKRSKRNIMIAGVCGGLAEYLDMDYSIVRILYALLSILSGGFIGLFIYFLSMLIIPQDY